MEFLKVIVLGVVEGLTEFLPVSSTGHLIVTGELIRFHPPYAATFEIFIQLGAILSVVVLYWDRFLGLLDFNKPDGFSGMRGLKLLFWTTLPALFFGALTHGFIKHHLFGSMTVAIGLGVGGLAIILVEQFVPEHRISGLDSLTWKQALIIGLFQCLALWPGVSRSAATILGAMLLGIERKTAAEYSFLAAVPVMCAATVFDLYKSGGALHSSDAGIFALGFVVSFLVAGFAVRFFIRFVGANTLKPFGWYRLVIAPLVFFFVK